MEGSWGDWECEGRLGQGHTCCFPLIRMFLMPPSQHRKAITMDPAWLSRPPIRELCPQEATGACGVCGESLRWLFGTSSSIWFGRLARAIRWAGEQ